MPSPSEVHTYLHGDQAMPSRLSTLRRVVALAAFPGAYLATIAVFALATIGLLAELIRSPAGGLSAMVLAVGALVCGLMAIAMWRALFEAGDIDRHSFVELSAEDEPQFFAFVDDLCDRCQTARPDRIYAFPAVNAGVYIRTTGAGFFGKTELNLLVGLGLINAVNRGELEAVLAHEFGHFSQRPLLLQHYVDALHRLLEKSIEYCDQGPALFTPMATMLRRMERTLRALDSRVSHDMELWADHMAVQVTGTDALVAALQTTEHAAKCYAQTLYDLEQTLAHDLRTADLYYHHSRLIESTEERPALTSQMTIQLSTSHPAPLLRHAMAHRAYRSSEVDERPAWSLFTDGDGLRRQLTDHHYQTNFADRAEDLTKSTRRVQSHLDNEHAEIILNPADSLVYGHRFLEPGDLDVALAASAELDVDDRELMESLGDLTGPQYSEAMQRVSRNLEAHRSAPAVAGTRALRDGPPAPPKPLEPGGQDDRQWLAQWDQRLLIASLCAARKEGEESYCELVARYRFHLSLQDLIRWIRAHTPHLGRVLAALDEEEVDADTQAQALEIASALHHQLSRGLTGMPPLPELHGLPHGQALSMVVFEGALIDGPDDDRSRLSQAWLQRFAAQWQEGLQRLDHLRRKSLGALLFYQRQIQARVVEAAG